MSIALIFLAGGAGQRMQSATPKQFLPLKGKPIALYSFEIFLKIPAIKEIVVVAASEWRSLFPGAHKFALPGARRQDSVFNGFSQLSEHHEWVLTHDSARPFLTKEMVEKLIDEGKKVGAATLGVPLKPTIKESSSDGIITKTLDRSKLVEIQTPQLLRKKTMHEGLALANAKSLDVTDDTALAELLDEPVKVVLGHYTNIKITTPDDLQLAELFLRQ